MSVASVTNMRYALLLCTGYRVRSPVSWRQLHNAVPRPSAWRRTENLGGVFGSNQVSLYYYSQSSLSLFLLGPNQLLFDNSQDNSFLALLSEELSIRGICSTATLSHCHCATLSLKAKRGSNPGQFNRTILFHVFWVEGRRSSQPCENLNSIWRDILRWESVS